MDLDNLIGKSRVNFYAVFTGHNKNHLMQKRKKKEPMQRDKDVVHSCRFRDHDSRAAKLMTQIIVK